MIIERKTNMKLFINDIPVCFASKKTAGSTHGFSAFFESGEAINPKLLVDNVLLNNPTNKTIDRLLDLMANDDFNRVTMITIVSESKKKVIEYLKSKFTLIEAGGGIVEKDGKYLMIHRKGQWDIPKGKMEEGETPKECAGREVAEETNVKVKVGEKIGAIWHTYMHKKKRILKKTNWYAMTCLDDSKMKPEEMESITDVRWMTMDEVQESLIDSYRSLRCLVQKYRSDKQ